MAHRHPANLTVRLIWVDVEVDEAIVTRAGAGRSRKSITGWEKALVFNTWMAVLDIIEALVRRLSFGCVRLNDKLSMVARWAVVVAFRDDDRCMIMPQRSAPGARGLR